MFEQTFKNIDDILHKDAGCGSELDYIEQTSWVLFLKYLDDLERDKATAAQLTVKIKLRDGKEREIQYMISTSFWSADGKPISVDEFMENLFGKLPELFKSEAELRTLWSNLLTRRTLLEKLEEAGFAKQDLITLQKLVNLEKSDLFDVLEYVFNSDIKTMTREERVSAAEATIFAILNEKQREFIEFVLSKYVESGVDELDQDKLPIFDYQQIPITAR